MIDIFPGQPILRACAFYAEGIVPSLCVTLCVTSIVCMQCVTPRWCEQDLCPVGTSEREGRFDPSTPPCDAALVYDEED